MTEPEGNTDNALWLYWARTEAVARNWGDALNPALVSFLSGRPVRHVDELPAEATADVHSVIGSHLQAANARWVVWGTGKARDEVPLGAAPRRICAVRGPLTRDAVLRQGIECPAVFGDCAIFFAAMLPARRNPIYDLGIIQHIREVGIIPLPPDCDATSTTFIDIGAGLNEVINQIVQCRRIVSSSLHGIIAAHVYGVPASWVKFSNLPKTNGFKFRDYWASVGCPAATAFIAGPETRMKDLNALRSPIRNALDFEALLEVCPILDDSRRHYIHGMMRAHYRMADLVERG
jgi:pyruvyltransferase